MRDFYWDILELIARALRFKQRSGSQSCSDIQFFFCEGMLVKKDRKDWNWQEVEGEEEEEEDVVTGLCLVGVYPT